MHALREKFQDTDDFLIGVELVSIRGSMSEKSALKARAFANELVDSPAIDWISITDNAGGNPQLAPHALGKPILYAGKEVVIHMTCKDLNRNGLESQAWFLNSEGFHNILAMTGDYPVSGNEGLAKPVFDIDSVGLIAMLNKMNHGFEFSRRPGSSPSQRLDKTNFFVGAVTTNFKFYEGEVIPQYLKLQKKVACGAQFIINQVGYDARKMHELRLYMDENTMRYVYLIGNLYLLNPRAAKYFHDGKIPGIVVTPELLALCQTQGASPDGGKAFFLEFAAKQMAIYRGLGYRGVYLGGVHDYDSICRILEIEQSFSPDDWKTFAPEIRFSQPGEFYYYAEDPATGLANAERPNPQGQSKPKHLSPVFQFSKWMHNKMFTPGSPLATLGKSLCSSATSTTQGPGVLRNLEHLSKGLLYGCRDCGDCSLPEIAFLCPESQCAKNQRNGPCGGTNNGRCEVSTFGDCIWLRSYDRLKADGREMHLLDHAPVVQNQGLRGTSAWANHWLGRDHTAKPLTIMPDATTKAAKPKQFDKLEVTT